jgi:hypothetical protein
VRELETQDHQGDDDPIGEDQVVVGARACGTQTAVAPTLVQLGLLLGSSGLGQLGDQPAQATTWQTGADAVGQGRAGPG